MCVRVFVCVCVCGGGGGGGGGGENDGDRNCFVIAELIHISKIFFVLLYKSFFGF